MIINFLVIILVNSLELQQAFLGSLANFSKTQQEPNSDVDHAIVEALQEVLTVMKSSEEDENLLIKGFKLLTRFAGQEHQVKLLIAGDLPRFLSSSLVHSVSKDNFVLVQEICNTISLLANGNSFYVFLISFHFTSNF